MRLLRGYSSAGRALEWHSRGQRFDPAYLHQTHYERLDFFGDQAFCFLENEYRDDAGSFHRRSSILPPTEKGRFHESKDRESGLFYCPNAFHRETDSCFSFEMTN